MKHSPRVSAIQRVNVTRARRTRSLSYIRNNFKAHGEDCYAKPEGSSEPLAVKSQEKKDMHDTKIVSVY